MRAKWQCMYMLAGRRVFTAAGQNATCHGMFGKVATASLHNDRQRYSSILDDQDFAKSSPCAVDSRTNCRRRRVHDMQAFCSRECRVFILVFRMRSHVCRYFGSLSKIQYFFGVADGMTEADKVRMSLGVYAVYRAANSLRRAPHANGDFNFMRYLRMWARAGSRGSPSHALLK